MLRYARRADGGRGFERPEDMPELLHRILCMRGVDSPGAAKRFLAPSADDLNDPFLLHDMDRAALRIRKALEKGEKICVYGDYDVDGVSASSILFLFFKSRGADVSCYIPSRHTEGYGLNEAALRSIAGEADLLLTVDCGINAVAMETLARELGMDMVVTDHHRPGEVLPDCPVVNPLLNDYPCPYLAGGGVAFKLVEAVAGREEALEYIDLAALATIADVVPLTGENRAIAAMGLKRMTENMRPGIAALRRCAGVEKNTVTAYEVGFQLGPRLNAGGRLGSAKRSFELLTTSDPARAEELAEELESENTLRRKIEQEILAQAEEQLKSFDFTARRILVVWGEGWNTGVLGLVASRLADRYHYPAIVFGEEDGVLTGSCRSIEGVDIFRALSAASEGLTRFGGHKQAAGLAMPKENYENFVANIEKYLWDNIPGEVYVPVKTYDTEAELSELDLLTVRELEKLEPTGMGNPAPVLRVKASVSDMRKVGADGAHLKLCLTEDGRRMDGIAFHMGALADKAFDRADVLFSASINAFMGRVNVQAKVSSIVPETQIPENLQAEILPFLTEMFYNTSMVEEHGATPLSEVLEAVGNEPRGTLLIARDGRAAKKALSALGDTPIDVFIGKWPEDRRCFNALCVLPAGEMPVGYKNVFRLPGVPDWYKEMPDKDDLREMYKALMRIARRPHVYSGFSGLAGLLSEEAGFTRTGCAAGLFALHDMELIQLTLSKEQVGYTVLPAAKKDPGDYPVFRKISEWRNIAEMQKGGQEA